MEDFFISAILYCKERECDLNSVICYLGHCVKRERCPELRRYEQRLRLKVLKKRIHQILPSRQLSLF